MIANGLVRGALPALGQPKTPATIPHSHRRGKEFRHRSVCAAGQPACTQVSRCTGLSGSDRKFPALTGRSGTQRARDRLGDHLIRRSGHFVQHRPSLAVSWAGIPDSSTCVSPRLVGWQQVWLQDQRRSDGILGRDYRPVHRCRAAWRVTPSRSPISVQDSPGRAGP